MGRCALGREGGGSQGCGGGGALVDLLVLREVEGGRSWHLASSWELSASNMTVGVELLGAPLGGASTAGGGGPL